MSAEMGWSPLGENMEVNPDRLTRAAEEGQAALSYAEKSDTHLWVVILTHRATDSLLDNLDGKIDGPPLLDADTLMDQPHVGCFVCEQPYQPRLRLRKCPGEPRRPGITRRA